MVFKDIYIYKLQLLYKRFQKLRDVEASIMIVKHKKKQLKKKKKKSILYTKSVTSRKTGQISVAV